MGLSLSTDFLADLLANDPEGAEWFRAKLALVNELLAAEGLPPHQEAERPGPAVARAHVAGFPYSFLHYLRRAFARVRKGLPVTPVAEGEDPAEDPAIGRVAAMLDAHLLCHSDAEGYYVPVDFEEVICDERRRGLPGGMLGSSVRLMAELLEVAPALGIRLDGDSLSDEEAAKLAEEREGSSPLWCERLVWLALFENARVSLANKTLLVFS